MSQTQATLKQKERKARTSLLNARRREQVIMKAEMGTNQRLAKATTVFGKGLELMNRKISPQL